MCEQYNGPRETDMERQLYSKLTLQKTVDLVLLETLCIAKDSQDIAETARILLYVDMSRPIALNVRRHPLTSSVQGRVVSVTDSGCGSIKVMEAVRQRWKN